MHPGAAGDEQLRKDSRARTDIGNPARAVEAGGDNQMIDESRGIGRPVSHVIGHSIRESL
jgi:hypothetical protein